MANSYTEVTLSAQQQNGFTTPAYIKQEHLKVYVNNVLVDGNTSVFGTLTTTANLTYSFVTETATSLNFSETLPTNTIVRIDRNSSQNARLNDYSDASLLTADVMDQDANQMFFVAQEALDQASKTNLAAGTFYYAQGTAPTSVAVGTVWFNTDSSPNTLQVWCGDTEGWRFVAPVHETTRYTNASGILFPVNGQPNSGNDAAYAGLAKIHDTGFTSSSYFHLNGVKQVSGTLAEVNATPATADYVFDQANNNIWFKPIANTDVIVIESFSGSFSQEVTAKEAAALNHRNDAEKLAINAENSQFTLSDGVTTDYSAKHFKALAEAARDLALQYKNDTNQLKADTDQLKTDTAQLKADTTQLKADTLQAKTDALQAETDAQTAQGLAENARDTALSHKNLAQEYATKAEDTNITGGTDKSALHYAAKAAASASAASTSESNAASTLANAVTLNTNQTITGAKDFTGAVSTNDLTVDLGTSNTIGTIKSSTGFAQLEVKSTATGGSADYGIIEVSGTDGGYIDIAKPDGAGYDLRIQHVDENNSVVVADTSNLVMQVQDTNRAVILKHGSNNPKLTTTTTGIDVTGTVTADGITLGDSEYIKIGEGNNAGIPDLQIFSGGGNAFIEQPSGSGNNTNLIIRGQNINLRNDADATLISTDNDQVRMWTQVAGAEDSTNGAAKFSTTTTGIDVNGTVTADGLNVDTSNNFAYINVGTAYLDVIGTDATSGLRLSNTNNTTAGQSDILFQRTANPVVNGTNTGIGQMLFEADNSGGSPFLFAGITVYADQFTAGAEEAFFAFTVEDGTGSRNEKLRINKDGIDVTGTVTADTFNLNTASTEFSAFTDNQDVTWLVKNGTGTLKLKSYKSDATDSTTDDGIHIRTDDLKLKNHTGGDIAQFSFDTATNTKTVNIDATVTADGLDIDGAVDVNTSNGNVDFDMGSGTFTITSTNTGDQLLLTNTNTGSGLDGAPDIVLRNLYTNVSEIVDNNILGSLHFGGNTLNVAGDAISGTTENFGRILCLSNDVTDGTHDGILDFRVADNGTTATRMQVKPDGIDVTGTVTATSITASQTAEVDTTNKTMANFKGQKVIHTGTTATYSFPDVVAGDVGTTWTVVNAGTGDITIDRASGATPNFSKLVTSSNPSSLTGLTLAKGGTIEMVVTAANTITCFGSGF